MREIDPLREPSEALLSAALHRLAKGSPRSAPKHLGANLVGSFRQHHARRRRARIAGWSALAACMIVAAILAVKFVGGRGNSVTPNIAVKVRQIQTPSVVQQAEEPAPQQVKNYSIVNHAVKANNDQSSGFVALPSYDPAINTGDLQVVRLELSGADLRLVGAPVGEDLSDRRMLADVVVGRDGTPYAVRFVQ